MLKKINIAGCVLAGVIGFQNYRLMAGTAGAYTVSTIDVPASSLTVACGIDILGRNWRSTMPPLPSFTSITRMPPRKSGI